MTSGIIITLCILVLLAYVFDITSAKTKIPSVILLLLLGWLLKNITLWFDLQIPDLSNALPLLGTIGLILIVLEGSLELEFNKSKVPLLTKSFMVSLIPLLALSFGLAFLLYQTGNYSYKDCLANVIPLSVISSSIAIPSAKNLAGYDREFVVYESSFSDIMGVLFFNFIVLNETIGTFTFGSFFLQLIIMLVVSFVSTVALSLLLKKIDHHIKFAPIILLIILIYTISNVYHLPALIFILIFGLFLGNLDQMKKIKWINDLNPVGFDKEVHKFKELTTEAAFLIRALFFILFGFLIEVKELLNIEQLALTGLIVLAIFFTRALALAILKMPVMPLLFIAPRGLITILLFLSVPISQIIPSVNKSVLIQVIVLTALVMMIGLLLNKKTEQVKG